MKFNYMITINVKFYTSSAENVESYDNIIDYFNKAQNISTERMINDMTKIKEILSKHGYNVSIHGRCFCYDYDCLDKEINHDIEFD